VSGRTIDAAGKVMAQGVPELIHAVEAKGVSVTSAAEVAELPKVEQAAVVAGGKKKVAAKAKELREQKRKGGKPGPGKSKAKKGGKDKQAKIAGNEPAAVAATELETAVTITLPAEIKGAGKALGQALLAHWNPFDVVEALDEAWDLADAEALALSRKTEADPGKDSGGKD